ncbi:MAG: site-specific DNA-methyltransferase [Campylobacteraceae bacterium]|jgi:site-specific DNA-methyltransferase (adenine-specific)|nr:site-specific DNA-methyltransferase [Campylobacteraceae bacterium]
MQKATVVYFGRGIMLAQMACELNQYFNFAEEIVWDKRNMSNPCGAIGRKHELINVFTRNRKINKVFEQEIKDEVVNQDFKRLLSSIKKIKNYADFKDWQKEVKEKVVKHNTTATLGLKNADRGYATYNKYKRGTLTTTIIAAQREHYNFIHPTQKPLELIKKLIKLATKEGDIVFDPFLGSGTTAVACKELGFDFVGCEIEKEYYEGALKRLENIQAVIKELT